MAFTSSAFLPSLRGALATKQSSLAAWLWIASLALAMTRKRSLFPYGCPRAASTALAAGQTLAFHAPDQEVDAVLAEERLVVEREGPHAPMAGRGMRGLVILDHVLIAIEVGRDRSVHRGEIETGGFRGAREVIALVPSLHRAVPQHPADRIREFQ